MPMSLSPSAILRAMRSAFGRGIDPRNSHAAYSAAYARSWQDRARRDRATRDDYQLHGVRMHNAAALEIAAQLCDGLTLS